MMVSWPIWLGICMVMGEERIWRGYRGEDSRLF